MTRNPKELFEYGNLLVEYDVDKDAYRCFETMVYAPLGVFRFEEGPGWIFYSHGSVVMDELRSLADLYEDLQEMYEGVFND